MHLTSTYSKIKKQNLVLIYNDTHQRETLSERPIRQPLKRCMVVYLSVGLYHLCNDTQFFVCFVSGFVCSGFFSETVGCKWHRRQNDFQSGGPDFWKSKMARQCRPLRLCDAGGCLRVMCPPQKLELFLKMWAQIKRFVALFFIILNI